MSYLVDTNVISEVRKGERCDHSVAEWWSGVAEDEIHFSVLTIGEIRKGIEKVRRRDPLHSDRLEAWLFQLITNYEERILPIELHVVEEWGRMSAHDPLPVVDALIAATAKVHGLTLVTRNVADIERTGVDMINPWEADR